MRQERLKGNICRGMFTFIIVNIMQSTIQTPYILHVSELKLHTQMCVFYVWVCVQTCLQSLVALHVPTSPHCTPFDINIPCPLWNFPNNYTNSIQAHLCDDILEEKYRKYSVMYAFLHLCIYRAKLKHFLYNFHPYSTTTHMGHDNYIIIQSPSDHDVMVAIILCMILLNISYVTPPHTVHS